MTLLAVIEHINKLQVGLSGDLSWLADEVLYVGFLLDGEYLVY